MAQMLNRLLKVGCALPSVPVNAHCLEQSALDNKQACHGGFITGLGQSTTCRAVFHLLVFLQPLNKSDSFQDIDNVIYAPSLDLKNGGSIIQRNDTALRSRKMLQELFTQQTK